MDNQLNGKTALVTGGTRGIGKVISLSLANEGAYTIINYAHNKEDAEKTVELIESFGGKALAIEADITEEADVQRLIEKVHFQTDTSIDIVVNNAIGPQPEMSIEKSTWDLYLDQLNFTVKAPLLITKAVVPYMKEKKFGRIINIGSEVIQLGNANFGNYVTAKSAMLGMTRSWANELGGHGITVNLVNPGFTPVERHENVDSETIEEYINSVPLQRIGEPKDIADSVVFLSSDKASFITGQSLSVNGGNTFGM